MLRPDRITRISLWEIDKETSDDIFSRTRRIGRSARSADAFNGRWRLKVSFIGDPHLKSYFPYDPREGNHIIVVRGLLRNATSQPAKTVFAVYVSDADGVAYQGQSLFAGNPAVAPKFGDVTLPPGAATPMQFPIEVPIGFVPAKLLIIPGFSESRPMRIDLTKAVKKPL